MNASLVNHGIIQHPARAVAVSRAEPRTIIITGLGRSGTSMVAELLLHAGVPLGEFLADAVHEDRELLDFLGRGDRAGLRRAIGSRNAAYRLWGFKLPNLHHYLHHAELAAFRNARLVITVRDVAAVAVRHAIAEHWDAFQAISDIADGTVALIHFARLTGCPILLISYEKALAFPDETISRITAFCGLSVDHPTYARMRECISPNNARYAEQARREYEGVVERVDEEGRLVGWCRQIGEITPVRLQLLADDAPLAAFYACLPRDDLLEAGLGNGNHGFAQPLDLAAIPAATRLHLRVAGTVWAPSGSGQSIAELTGRKDPPAPEPPAPEARVQAPPEPMHPLTGDAVSGRRRAGGR